MDDKMNQQSGMYKNSMMDQGRGSMMSSLNDPPQSSPFSLFGPPIG